MNKEKTTIRHLKKISIISVCVSAVFLFISLFCIYIVKIQTLSVISWCLFGISFIITCVVTIARGFMEVRKKRVK